MERKECEIILRIMNEVIDAGHMERYYTVLTDLVYSLQNRQISNNILELGTGYGHSLVCLALAAKAIDGRVYTIDNDVERVNRIARPTINKFDLQNYVGFIEGDTLSTQIIDKLANFTFGLIFLDSSHLQIPTLTELSTYSRLLDKGGYLVLHDTNEESVKHALSEFLSNRGDEFILALEFIQMPSLTVLRKIK